LGACFIFVSVSLKNSGVNQGQFGEKLKKVKSFALPGNPFLFCLNENKNEVRTQHLRDALESEKI
jgi:hypothetical protein